MFSIKLRRQLAKLEGYERVTLMLLILAYAMYTVTAVSWSWFELPGVASYGLWVAELVDFEGRPHLVPAFFTNEPGAYHLLQIIFLFAWAGVCLPIWMLLSDRFDSKIRRFIKRNKQQVVAGICFISVFAMTGGLYLFYYIINEFPREIGKYPQMRWASKLVSLACVLQFLAGLVML